jgi:hypothetical protein
LSRLYHERSRVSWILKIKSGKQGAVDRSVLPFQGAVIKLETDDRTWRTEDPHLTDFNSRDYGAVHRSAISAGAGMAEAVVFEDSSNQSYASLRHADTPFSMLVADTQRMWSNDLKIFIRTILRELVKHEVLPEKIKIEKVPVAEALKLVTGLLSKNSEDIKLVQEAADKLKVIMESAQVNEFVESQIVNTVDLPITIIFPRSLGDNPLLFAQAVTILSQAGIISTRTAQKWIGLDSKIEAMLIKYDIPKDNVQTGKTETARTNYDKKLNRDTTV